MTVRNLSEISDRDHAMPSVDRADPPEAPPLDPRIVPWNAALLVRRACPACASPKFDAVVRRPDGLIAGRCRQCGLHYLPDVPRADHLAAFYERYSTSHQSWHQSRTQAGALAAARRRRGGNGILREVARRRRLAGSSLLEIGCSRGSFLLDAREAGASVAGVEIDDDARRFVSALGIPCHPTIAVAAAATRYDMIVALNVIEHLADPACWLEEVVAALAPGGLLVLWTPNAAQADTLGAGWVGFRVDLDHLTYFSAKTLTPMLVRNGVWPEAIWEFSQAELSGFRDHGPATGTSRLARLARSLPRRSAHAWSLPPTGGSYTLCVFASRP